MAYVNPDERERQIEQLVKDHWGEPCKEFAPGCPVCEAWYLYNNGTVPTQALVNKAIERAKRFK